MDTLGTRATPPQAGETRPNFLPLWPLLLLALLSASVDVSSKTVPAFAGFAPECRRWLSTSGYLYNLLVLYRMTKVLERQPAWWGSYSAWGVVWRQFVPLYGIYVFYQFTKEAGRYADWRNSTTTKVGGWSFFVWLLAGLTPGRPGWDVLGAVLLPLSFWLLYRQLEPALRQPEPGS